MPERILDEKLEKEIKGKVDKGLKEARERVETAKETIELKEREVSEKIKERPLEWVAGAFIAGLLIGKILSK
ncbi:MAG: hypothetical protein DRO76_04285 [Candidatus Altiarchaeales archaeon]|nr:MAG: hypothetical protein DRO76_04285 [Candidatus Altiarchaeales archaeon]